jgi:hypothetical protein
MAPDILKIDPDCHPNLGDAAWNFRDEVFRWLLHGDSLSDPRDRLIPFFGKFESSGVSGSTGRGRSQALENKVRFADNLETTGRFEKANHTSKLAWLRPPAPGHQ